MKRTIYIDISLKNECLKLKRFVEKSLDKKMASSIDVTGT